MCSAGLLTSPRFRRSGTVPSTLSRSGSELGQLVKWDVTLIIQRSGCDASTLTARTDRQVYRYRTGFGRKEAATTSNFRKHINRNGK